jgi:hypothetical protein
MVLNIDACRKPHSSEGDISPLHSDVRAAAEIKTTVLYSSSSS